MHDQDIILHVRYRSHWDQLVVFFAQDSQPVPEESVTAFHDCRIPRTVKSKISGLLEKWADRAKTDIEIPDELEPTVTESDTPSWWDVTRELAIAKLKNLEQDPIHTAIAEKLRPANTNYYLYLRDLEPRVLAELQSQALTNSDLPDNLARKFAP